MIFFSKKTVIFIISDLFCFKNENSQKWQIPLNLFFSVTPFLDYEKVHAMVLILNTIICCSHPLNFAIYCSMSR